MLSQQALFELFLQQHNWQDRYRQLILLSKQLPDFPDDQKIVENQVQGCENRVWLTYQQQPDNSITFQGDSDGRIIKGLLAVLLILVNGKTKAEIQQLNFQSLFRELKITDELSSSRQQGLKKLIDRIYQVCGMTAEL